MPFVTLLYPAGVRNPGIRRQIIYGLDADKSASPDVGDAYVATDTNKFYLCFVANNWSAPFILSVPTSGQYQIKNIVQLADGSWKVIYEETPEP